MDRRLSRNNYCGLHLSCGMQSDPVSFRVADLRNPAYARQKGLLTDDTASRAFHTAEDGIKFAIAIQVDHDTIRRRPEPIPVGNGPGHSWPLIGKDGQVWPFRLVAHGNAQDSFVKADSAGEIGCWNLKPVNDGCDGFFCSRHGFSSSMGRRYAGAADSIVSAAKFVLA